MHIKIFSNKLAAIFLLLHVTVMMQAQLDLDFSVNRGFYDTPFTLELTIDDPAASIRYTTNNSKPTSSSGTLYTGPISISGTESIRAIAYNAAGQTDVVTHTYIFLDEIINASYMETNITNDATYGPMMRDALLAIPSVSLVSTSVSSNDAIDFEVETSVEMFFPDGSSAFDVRSGIQTWGGSPTNPKRHYRLEFKAQYGTSKLKYPLFDDGYNYAIPPVNEFDRLILRAGSQDGLNCEFCDESKAQFVRNRFIWDVQMAMGHPAPHGRWVHLYANGEYMGHYHFMERPDEAWFESYYFPEKMKEEIEVRKSDKYWNQPVSPTFYDQIPGYDSDYVDLEQTADYLILNDYGANFDWGNSHNNLGGADPIPGNGGYKFVVWDFDLAIGNEGIFEASYGNLLTRNSVSSIGPVPFDVANNSEFKVLQGDKIECHCFNDGVLTPDVLDSMYMIRANEVQLPLVAESARWGNVPFTYSSHTAKANWDVNDEFMTELNDLRNNYFPGRTNIMVGHYEDDGRYPSTQSVQFSQFGGDVPSGYQLTLSNPNGNGTIYYTTDGTDPRNPGGSISASAQVYNGAITVTGPVEIRARVYISISNWSAMCPRRFYLQQDRTVLVINEIMYHADSICRPVDWSETEYLEIKNTGSSTIDLTDCRFSSGINYIFPWGTTIAPGAFLVLAEDPIIFNQEFGFNAFAQYKGELSNDGELVQLVDFKGRVLDEVRYNDVNPWDQRPDGDGPSLELLHPTLDNADPLNWFRADSGCNGTPGQENSRICAVSASPIIINEINYNADNMASDPGDWVELHNPNATDVDISNWEFYDNDNLYVIPSGTIIPAGGFLVLTESAALFTSIFPQVGNYIGDFAFNLNKKGERISLFDANKCLSDYVVYNDKAPWPEEPDGGGPTLSLIYPPSADNALPGSWESSSAINSAYGTPGRENTPCPESSILSPPLVCAGVAANFTVDTAYVDASYTWYFFGGTPGTATGANPSVTWNSSGTYTVQLIMTVDECTKIRTVTVNVDCTISDTLTVLEDNTLNDALNTPAESNTNLISDVSNGSLSLNADGTFVYSPDAEYSGSDNFIYETCEGTLVIDTTIVTSIKNYQGQVTSGEDDVEEFATTGLIEAASGDLDLMVDGASVYESVGIRITNINVPQGVLITNAYLQFVADEANSGVTNLTVSAENTSNALPILTTAFNVSSKPRTATVPWNNVAPWTISGTYNSPDISTVVQEIVNKGDWSAGNAMTFILEGSGTRTAETYEGGAAVAPKLFVNYESIDGIIIDSTGTEVCTPSLILIDVLPVNDAPIANADNESTDEDVISTGNVLSNDSDIDGTLTLTTTPTASPANGALTLNPNGTYEYMSNPNFNGTDSFEYEVCDDGSPSLCSTAIVTFTVNAVNDAPIAIDDTESTQEDMVINGDVLPNDSDVDGELTVNSTPVAPPVNGTLTLNSDGTYTYTPDPNFNGADSFEYEVCDDGEPELCDIALVNITVNSVNDQPITIDDAISTVEDISATGNLSTNDLNVDGDTHALSTIPVTQPTNGSVFILASGFYAYTPNLNFNGTDSFEYEVCDDGDPVLCNTAIVNITITPEQDAPIAADDSGLTQEDIALIGNVIINDSDIDGDNLMVNTTPVSDVTNGVLSLSANGDYTYLPDTGFSGTDSFEYEVCDDGDPILCTTAIVNITIEEGCATIELFAWLEGAYIAANEEMHTELNVVRGLLPGQTPTSALVSPTPDGQPYSQSPWNYAGIEGDGWTDADYIAYPVEVVDWIFVSFRADIARSTQIGQGAALIHKDGSITFPERCALPVVAGLDSVYVVLEHRNHMGVMTPQAIPIVNNLVSYDFRTANTYKDLTSFGQKELPSGEWSMFAGDGNQEYDFPSYDISGPDKTIWLEDNGVFNMYMMPDFNLDGDINGADKILWTENNGVSSRVPK